MGLRETSSKNVKVGSKWKYLSDRKPSPERRGNISFVVTRITTKVIQFSEPQGYSHDRTPGDFIKELVPLSLIEPELLTQIKTLICQLALKPVDRIKLLEELVRSDI